VSFKSASLYWDILTHIKTEIHIGVLWYCWNRLDVSVLKEESNPLLTDFGMHHRLESCVALQKTRAGQKLLKSFRLKGEIKSSNQKLACPTSQIMAQVSNLLDYRQSSRTNADITFTQPIAKANIHI